MNSKINTLFSSVVAFLLVVPFTTGLIDHLYQSNQSPVRPRDYLLAVSLLAVALYAYNRAGLNTPVLWLIGLITLRLGTCLLSPSQGVDLQLLTMSMFSGLIFCLALSVTLRGEKPLRYAAFLCGIVTIAVNSMLNIMELFGLVSYSNTTDRVAGWLANPNGAALSIVSMMAVLLALRPPMWLAISAIMVSVAGILPTYSRAGYLVCSLILIQYFWYVSKARWWKAIGLTVIACVGAGGIGWYVLIHTTSTGVDIEARKGILQGDGSMFVDTQDERVRLYKEAWSAVLEKPIIGHGPATSLIYTPHNQVLAVWLDNGLVGLAAFLSALIILIKSLLERGRLRVLCAFPLIGYLPFGHNILEDKLTLALWVFAAAMSQQYEGAPGSVKASHSRQPAERPGSSHSVASAGGLGHGRLGNRKHFGNHNPEGERLPRHSV